MTCRFAELDAAYVLGSLAPVERADYERHLTECDDCSRSVADLAGMPGLLARVPADVLADPGPVVDVPAALLPRLATAARRDQRRRTTRAALLAAAAVAVVAGGSVAVVATLDDDTAPFAAPAPGTVTVTTSTGSPTDPSTAPSERLDPVGSTTSTGWLALTETAWGTRLDLTCEYDVPAGGADDPYGNALDLSYAMVVRSADGEVEQVASFTPVSGRAVHVTGATALSPDAIASVEVQTSTGTTVLRLAH